MGKRVIIVASWVVVLSILGTLGIIIYTKFGIGVPCLFHETTGFFCAGCGMTRAIVSLSNLEFYQAFRYNCFSLIVIPFLITYCLVESYYWVLNRKNHFEKIFQVVAVVIVVGLLTYSILRNIPAFSWLAPTDII